MSPQTQCAPVVYELFPRAVTQAPWFEIALHGRGEGRFSELFSLGARLRTIANWESQSAYCTLRPRGGAYPPEVFCSLSLVFSGGPALLSKIEAHLSELGIARIDVSE